MFALTNTWWAAPHLTAIVSPALAGRSPGSRKAVVRTASWTRSFLGRGTGKFSLWWTCAGSSNRRECKISLDIWMKFLSRRIRPRLPPSLWREQSRRGWRWLWSKPLRNALRCAARTSPLSSEGSASLVRPRRLKIPESTRSLGILTNSAYALGFPRESRRLCFSRCHGDTSRRSELIRSSKKEGDDGDEGIKMVSYVVSSIELLLQEGVDCREDVCSVHFCSWLNVVLAGDHNLLVVKDVRVVLWDARDDYGEPLLARFVDLRLNRKRVSHDFTFVEFPSLFKLTALFTHEG